jgi:plastocyanin
LTLIAVFALSNISYSFESKIVIDFLAAYDAKDAIGMTAITEKNKEKIPSEVLALLYEAVLQKTTEEDREANFFIAELLAKSYKDVTGDIEPLLNVKRTVFDSKLTQPLISKAEDGVHIVELPETDENETNIFKPDNVIIKQGETVRWVNRDKVAHIFASMPFIGLGGIFTPNIEPGESWEYKFEEPGDYYYLCFIHRGMVGKIIVESAVVEGEGQTDEEQPAEQAVEQPADMPVEKPSSETGEMPAKEPVHE